MTRSKFILTSEPRNIVNNYEISALLDDMSRTYPIFSDYIQSNVRNYIIKRFPCVRVSEEDGHRIYQEYFKQDKYSLNPEVIISKGKNPESDLHQVLISVLLLTQLRHAMEYLIVHNISPKPNYNVNDLCRKADDWNKKLLKQQDSVEGLVEVVQEHQGKKWVVLKDYQAFRREAALMRNCIKSYYSSSQNGTLRIFSLRDENNNPLVTMEVTGNHIVQVKGFANGNAKKFDKEIYYFMLTFKLQKRLHMSEFEMNHLHPYIGILPYNNEFDDLEFSHGSFLLRSIKFIFGLVFKAARGVWFYLDFVFYLLKNSK